MKLHTVAPRQGALWVRSGFRIFFKRPLAFASLFASFLFGAMVLLLVPGLGGVLLLTALPLVTQGFMVGTRRALQGRPPLPDVYVEPLRGERSRRVEMLKLGLIYAAASFAIMWISNVADAGKFGALQDAMTTSPSDPQALQALMLDPQLQWGMLLRLSLASLLSLPFWHAPALVHWGAQSALKALFFSAIACWRNKGAFTVYGLTWLAVMLLFGVLSNLVFALLGTPALVVTAALPAGLMFSTVFYASLYFTFADCFDPPGVDGPGGDKPVVDTPALP